MSSTSERISRFQRPSSRAADAALVLPPELRTKAPPAPRGLARLIRSFAVILFGDVVATLLGVVLADRLDAATISYVVLLPAWLGLLGLYRIRVAPTVQTDLVPLLGALACPTFVLALIRTPGTEGLLHDVPITAGLVVLGRLVSYQVLRTVRSHSRYTEPTLIVGAGALGCQLAKALLDHPEYGMKPVGFLDGFPDDGTLPVPMVGDIDAFDEVLRSTGAKRVIVAFGANREADLVAVLRASALADVEVHIMPRLFEIGVIRSGHRQHLGLPAPARQACSAAHAGMANQAGGGCHRFDNGAGPLLTSVRRRGHPRQAVEPRPRPLPSAEARPAWGGNGDLQVPQHAA
jgi:hypothetical protein